MALLEMQIGCLALNGIPARQGKAYDGKSTIDIMAPIGVGNVKPIRWAWVYGLWVARALVLTEVSWDQLNQYGLATGKEVEISGVKYQVRCPQLGAYDGQPNEWDAILKDAGERDPFNSFNYMLEGRFWGSDTCPDGWHPIREGGWAPRKGYLAANFRPVMRPIIIEPDNRWTGATLQVLSKSGEAIVGVLDEVDDYDFLLSNVTRAPQGRRKSVQSFYRPLGRKRAAVDRSQVLYVQEYFSA